MKKIEKIKYIDMAGKIIYQEDNHGIYAKKNKKFVYKFKLYQAINVTHAGGVKTILCRNLL